MAAKREAGVLQGLSSPRPNQPAMSTAACGMHSGRARGPGCETLRYASQGADVTRTALGGSSTMPRETGSPVIPGLRYLDAPAAIRWLCEAFGFEEHLVVPGENGTIAHAQLSFGTGMIMLGSEPHEGEFAKFQKPPRMLGGVVSQSAYIVVPDADVHYERAVAAGAEIVLPIEDHSYGGRGYSCRDPEGHLWSIGSYDPWAEQGKGAEG